MGNVVYVDFKRRCRVSAIWLMEQERLFTRMMVDRETPTPEEYYGNAPSDSEPE
jgi:hypothetical protein